MNKSTKLNPSIDSSELKNGETKETQETTSDIANFAVTPKPQPAGKGETDLVYTWPSEVDRPCWGVYDEGLKEGAVIRKSGVWLHKIVFREENKPPKLIDTWVCSPLHILAITSSKDTNFGRLIRFQNINEVWNTWSMPMTMLSGGQEPLKEELLRMGLSINLKEKSLLSEYINTRNPEKRVIAAQQTGWIESKTFVFPKKTIGNQNVIYQASQQLCSDYSSNGSLEEWQKEVGNLCIGNPLLIHAVSFSLAGPLLKILHIDNGGFHYRGDSSTGKTTSLLVACSLWGQPQKFVRTWRATSNGLEAISTDRNDTTLILDELGQANPQEVNQVVYAITNGIGKQRSNKTGAAQIISTWRQTILSSGELSPESIIAQTSQSAQAGVLLRLLDINCNHRFGLFDDLHNFSSGREMSDNLRRASDQYYGIIGPLFIEKLIEIEQKQLSDQFADIRAQFICNHDQENRPATRFALAAFAGELGISFGILPWTKGSPTKASLELFKEWQQGRGQGNIEEQKILKSVADYVNRYGDSRFSEHGAPAKPISDRAGWWKMSANDEIRIWMFTSAGLQQASKGHDLSRVIRALNNANWIVAKDSNKNSKNTRIPGYGSKRLYYITTEDFNNDK